MGYCMAVHVWTIMSSVMYKNKFRIVGAGVLRRVLMIPCEMFLRYHLSSTRIVSLIGSGRGRVGVKYTVYP